MAGTKTYTDKNVVATSLLVSISDVLLNLIVALITGSRVILAQAFQGFSDLTTAAILYTGVVRSKRKADAKHPLGYGREIFFWVLIAAMFMFIGTGLITLFIGIQQIILAEELDTTWLALFMAMFGLTTNFYAFRKSLVRMHRNIGRRSLWRQFRDSSMIETKATFIVDFLGTTSAALGLVSLLLYALTGNARFDGAGSALVGLSMMLAAVFLVLDVRDLIVGKAVPLSIIRKIRSATLKHEEVEEILDLRTLYLGSSNIMILMEVHLNENLRTNQIEKLIDAIRRDIQARVPHAYHLQIEVETPDSEL